MKVIAATGLAPVVFLMATGPYAEGQIAGLDPVVVRRLEQAERPIIKRVPIDEDQYATLEVDEETLLPIEVPGLGGYDHMPPLASDLLPGRNRFAEPLQPETPLGENPQALKAVESGIGRMGGTPEFATARESAEGQRATNAVETGSKASKGRARGVVIETDGGDAPAAPDAPDAPDAPAGETEGATA